MTAEEVWRKACAAYEDAAEEHPEMPLRDMVIAGENAAVSVIRTAMEAYAAEALAADQTEAMEYRVGDKVVKPRGYAFPGTVVAAFMVAGGQRYVIESELAPGMLHIFSPSQLAIAANPHHGGNDADT